VTPELRRVTISVMARRVLIVDDHPEFRALARAMLERDGFEVVGEAVDGAGTLIAVEQTRPEVVLLDVQLPDVNGFDIALTLSEGESAPVIVMTSTRDAADFGGRLERSGARGFIAKSRLSGAALAELVS
jgi:DNA-binding NarL/FixJ family response regulator